MRYFLIGLAVLAAVGACQMISPGDPGVMVPKTVDEDPTLPYLEVNGTKLHVETYGDSNNDVLIFLHGGPGGAMNHGMRLTNLADTFYFVIFDQRGCGLSRRHDPDIYNMDLLTEDLDQLIDHFTTNDTQKVHLLGHSWGGQYVTFYINAHPDRVDKAIVTDPGRHRCVEHLHYRYVDKAIVTDPGPFTSEIYATMPIFDMGLNEQWLNDAVYNNEFFTPDDHERLDFSLQITSFGVDNYHESMTDHSAEGRGGYVAHFAIEGSAVDANGKMYFDFTENLDQYTNEVLFIRSGLNEVHTPQYMSNEMAFYPSARLETIPDVGHDMDWVAWQEYSALVRDFITNG